MPKLSNETAHWWKCYDCKHKAEDFKCGDSMLDGGMYFSCKLYDEKPAFPMRKELPCEGYEKMDSNT